MYIDVHCHFDLLEDSEGVIARARKGCVGTIVAAAVDEKTIEKVLAFAKHYPEVRAAVGLYPMNALALSDKKIQDIIATIRAGKKNIVGIGEVGMDFKEDATNHERQRFIFSQFIALANELDKPVIVHSRKAEKECIEVLEACKAKKVVMHCFSGNFKLVKRIVENAWTCSIPTCVTHAEHFQKMIAEIPIEQLLCETDAPYLHPKKEFPNEPANVVASYEMIAKIKGISLKTVEKQLEKNYDILF